jgi:hypothetical protein
MEQEAAETKNWLGGGSAFGSHGQSDVNKSEGLDGVTLEVMVSHQIFDDSMALGKAFLDTRFEHGFEDGYGNYHQVNARVLHGYYSLGVGKSFELLNSFQVGATADLVGGLGLVAFDKYYKTASGQEIKFDRKFGGDILVGYQWAIFMDFGNYWTIGLKSSVYRNRIYVEFGGIDAHVNHIHSNMIFIGLKKGFVDCVPTLYQDPSTC